MLELYVNPKISTQFLVMTIASVVGVKTIIPAYKCFQVYMPLPNAFAFYLYCLWCSKYLCIRVLYSMLVLRQILLSENSGTSPTEVEHIVTESFKRVSELLDRVANAGIAEIVATAIGPLFAGSAVDINNVDKLQSRKAVMGSMLSKSLRDGDPVFSRVAHAVYLAVRGAVFCGSSSNGKKLVVMALRPVGAAFHSEEVAVAAGVLTAVATVSGRVHGPWYACLVKNM